MDSKNRPHYTFHTGQDDPGILPLNFFCFLTIFQSLVENSNTST
jgi:hypothetical protein